MTSNLSKAFDDAKKEQEEKEDASYQESIRIKLEHGRMVFESKTDSCF